MSCCCPSDDSLVTDWPDPPVSLIAGEPEGELPAGTTKTTKLVPAVGAGVHWKAHPICQPAAVTAKTGLVQFPVICDDSSRRCAGAVVVVAEPLLAVAADVVVVLPPAAGVGALVEADPAGADVEDVVVLADPDCVGRV